MVTASFGNTTLIVALPAMTARVKKNDPEFKKNVIGRIPLGRIADPKDVEMLEDLVLVAVNEAQKKAADLAQTEMSRLTGG